MSCGYPGRPLLVVIVKLNKGQPMAVVAGQKILLQADYHLYYGRQLVLVS